MAGGFAVAGRGIQVPRDRERRRDLARHPRILGKVEQVLGPDILVWSTGFFSKKPHDPLYVSWHQDSTYWPLEPADIVSAWVAFTPSRRANGCMRVVPGTHTLGQVEHVDSFADEKLLSRGHEVRVDVDESQSFAAADRSHVPRLSEGVTGVRGANREGLAG